MQFASTRARAPSSSSAQDVTFAAIAPLPAEDQCHYLRRSVVRRKISQSESSLSPSDSNESEGDDDESSSSSSGSDTDSAADESDDDDSDSSARSLGSRSASSRYDSQDSEWSEPDDDDDDETHTRVPIHDSSVKTSAMSVQRGSATFAWHSDNLGVVALLIPITGVSTMVLTEVLACATHFDCSKEYPTLSYAAEFKPEGHAFTLGMCATAIFILASVALFHWFARLKLFHPKVDSATVVATHGCLVAGAIAAGSLFGLAVFDMGAYHDAHIAFTVLFFVFAWVTMLAVQATRRRLLRDQDTAKPHRASTGATSPVWRVLQRWKRISVRESYQLGRVFLYAGLTATGLFALLFLCVNGMWPNPLGFTAVQEALLEAFAIFCQLFFMGTLSCELSKLTRVVEHREYEELERAE